MEDKSICKVDEYGTKRWILNGKYHRIGGPAIEYYDSYNHKFWWLDGKIIDCNSQEEFEYYLKYKAFL